MSPMSQVKVTAMKISTYCEIAGIRPQRTSPVFRGSAEEKDVDGGDRHHREKDREDLRHGELDPDRRLDEVPVDAEEDDEDRDGREDRELRRMARLRPRHRRDLPGPAVEEEAHEGREDQDVHRGVLRRHDTEEAQHRVRRSSHRPDLGDRRDDRPRRRVLYIYFEPSYCFVLRDEPLQLHNWQGNSGNNSMLTLVALKANSATAITVPRTTARPTRARSGASLRRR